MKKKYIIPNAECLIIIPESQIAAASTEDATDPSLSDAKQKGEVDEEDEDEFEAALWQVNH